VTFSPTNLQHSLTWAFREVDGTGFSGMRCLWRPGYGVHSASQQGASATSRPSSRSRSPWANISSVTITPHSIAVGKSFVTLDTSAHLSSSCRPRSKKADHKKIRVALGRAGRAMRLLRNGSLHRFLYARIFQGARTSEHRNCAPAATVVAAAALRLSPSLRCPALAANSPRGPQE
jgi:hypothetical protein